MHVFHRPPARLHAFFLAILIAALLCSHWQGLAHRINHASRMLDGVGTAAQVANALAVATPIAADDAAPQHLDAGHSCLAFDAATIGACLGSSPFVIAVPPHAPLMALWLAFISYQAPFTAHFSSRAPPQS